MTIAFFMFLSIVIPLLLGMPIAVSLGLTGLGWLTLLDPESLRWVKGASGAIWNTANNGTLISVPLFVLMGEALQRTGIGKRFYRGVSAALSWVPGGALHTNIAACSLISAVSGSSVATAATVGSAAIPNLLRLNYDRKLVFGSLAAGGTLGVLIPPSIPMIIYAALTEQSVGRLFAAALIPGLAITGLFLLYIAVRSFFLPKEMLHSGAEARDERSLLGALLDIAPFVVIFITIIGCLYGGIATPTEIAAVGVVIVLVVAAFYREVNPKMIWEASIASTRITSIILFVVIGAQIFSYAMFGWGVTRTMVGWVVDLAVDPLVVFAALSLIYLFLGMFIDPISMMVLTLGVVFPIITQLGFDPIWFGIVLVLLVEIGLITPPVGINLFTIQAIAPRGTSLLEVAKGSLPFVGLLLLGVVLLIAFPELALWLPDQWY